ncbi:MAG: hypothetical protein BGO15_01360 [Microbacterium sp. 71-23]|nr:MAG: hypothetical protein ABT08_01825 [Microbacterium sp. SCN 71-21]OJU75609.1 MAG: hypothetical protein BGO15_01360 [Microbacterium sp. 71-23]
MRSRRLARTTALLMSFAAVLGVAFGIAPAANAASVPTVGVITLTAPATVDEGDTVTVSVAVDASTDLFAYDLGITYDPTLLSYDGSSAVFPAGGYGTSAPSGGVVTFTSTRLGTSPALSGAQTLVTFTFTARAGGAATIALTSLTLVGTAAVTDSPSLTAVTPVVTAITPAPTPTPTPSETATATPTPTPSVTGSAASTDDDLANTGGTTGAWIVLGAGGLALVALGVVLAARRKAVQR